MQLEEEKKTHDVAGRPFLPENHIISIGGAPCRDITLLN